MFQTFACRIVKSNLFKIRLKWYVLNGKKKKNELQKMYSNKQKQRKNKKENNVQKKNR